MTKLSADKQKTKQNQRNKSLQAKSQGWKPSKATMDDFKYGVRGPVLVLTAKIEL